MNKLRLAMIGLGSRGRGLLKTAYLEHPLAQFTTICDKYEDRCIECADIVQQAGFPRPKTTTNYKEIL